MNIEVTNINSYKKGTADIFFELEDGRMTGIELKGLEAKEFKEELNKLAEKYVKRRYER